MARRRKGPEPPSGPKGAPEWVVTFTDMISLLVTFFVLLMTFSSLDAYDAQLVDSWLTGSTGVHKTSGFAMLEPGNEDRISGASIERGANLPHSRPADKLPESLEEMGQRRSEEHRELDLNDVGDGLVLEFGEDECFEPGSVVVPPELRKSLTEIGHVLENYPHLVVVEGFTDDAFLPGDRYATSDELSVARANAAARVLLATSGMRPELLQVSGHGARRARADNVSPSGRRLNRRIQLRILSLSKVRANYLLTREAEERAG